MRLLADECVDMRVVRQLRTAGHDVLSILETEPGIMDAVVLERALAAGRILITHDKDFGPLLLGASAAGPGAFLLRSVNVSVCAAAILDNIDQVQGNLIVVSDDRIRVRPLIS
jgi:predicted nuclease of predicted toxin-antitoxin system